MLSKEHIQEQLHTSWAASYISYKDVTDSTNNDAKRLAEEGAPHGMLVVADKQEAGRGSRGRYWETPAGTNIAMSLIVRPQIPVERVPQLTLVMGLSVAEGIDLAIHESGADSSFACKIKWPNDVVLEGRKCCGILTELHMSPEGGISDVVIGVGINVNMFKFSPEIEGVAGSLLTQTGVRTDRSLVVARVMERFEENYRRFIERCTMELLRQQYEERLINKGQEVMLLEGTPSVRDRDEVEKSFKSKTSQQGVAKGITDMGELVVQMDDGQIKNVAAGDVSVRGIYGYV